MPNSFFRILHPVGSSQSSYITEAFAQRLQMKWRHNEMPITGINNTCSAATHSMDIKFSSKDNKYSNVVTCFILPNLMGNMPSSFIDITTLRLPKGITLADDEFNIPGKTDMLIGSDLYPYLMKNGCYTYGKNHPVVQETHLGWILLGRIPNEGADRSTVLFICNEPPIAFKLQRFWEQEEIVSPIHTKEEEAVERHFVETTTRDETGRLENSQEVYKKSKQEQNPKDFNRNQPKGREQGGGSGYHQTPRDVRHVRYGYRQSNPGPPYRQNTSVQRCNYQKDRRTMRQAHKLNHQIPEFWLRNTDERQRSEQVGMYTEGTMVNNPNQEN